MNSFFITGTDTGVGKTVITAALAALLTRQGQAVCVYKPVQTGAQTPEDLKTIKTLTGLTHLATHCSYCFDTPATPSVADREGMIRVEQLQTDFERLQKKYDAVLVEGAGGIHVPITNDTRMVDLMQTFGLPVIIVVRPGLGTINHTLLSVEALQAHKIPVHGVVVSGYPISTDDLAITTLPQIFRQWLSGLPLALVPQWDLQPGSLNPDSLLLCAVEPLLRRSNVL